jgi:hypothetical protein
MWAQRLAIRDFGNVGAITFGTVTEAIVFCFARNAMQETRTYRSFEVAGSSLTREQIVEFEMTWQTKLGSRAKRLDNE